jgi:hypothetical protein
MSPGEMQAAMEENTKLRICPSCPSYTGPGESKVFSCGLGKARLLARKAGTASPGDRYQLISLIQGKLPGCVLQTMEVTRMND